MGVGQRGKSECCHDVRKYSNEFFTDCPMVFDNQLIKHRNDPNILFSTMVRYGQTSTFGNNYRQRFPYFPKTMNIFFNADLIYSINCHSEYSNSSTTMSRKAAVSGYWIKSRSISIIRYWHRIQTRQKKLFLFFHIILFGVRELLRSIIAVVLKSLTRVMPECCFKHRLKVTIINLFL